MVDDGSATDDASVATSSKKDDDDADAAGGTLLIIIIIVCVLLLLLCFMVLLAYRNKERKLTERKDSWDISTMFTDEANLPDAEEMIDVEPESSAPDVAGATLIEGEDQALVPLDEDQPQALQKITQAAEL